MGGLKATRALAKVLAQRLYEPTRLEGEAVWQREERGWRLDSFKVDRFVPLERADAGLLLERLAALGKDLPADIIDRVHAGRSPGREEKA